MKKIVFGVCVIALIAAAAGCVLFDPLARYDSQIDRSLPQLYTVYEDSFAVGAAIEPQQLLEAEGALLRRHFNSITPENAMKFVSIHPGPDEWNFEPMDAIVDYASRYRMELRGHTFVWHHPDEIADWMFFHADGTRKSREEALAMLEDHIRVLMTRYGDSVTAWDVVNEAIDMDQPDYMRRTPWYETIGPDYVHRAFEIAHRIDPDARLFYNDYMTYDPRKNQAIYDLVKSIQDEGIPVHGIGMQMHLTLVYPEIEALEFAIQRFKRLDVEIHITELDMSLYTQEFEVLDSAPEDYLIHQAYRYRALFDLFTKYQDTIGSVTLWGFHDGHTWLTGAPYNRGDWPLIFDADLRPKLAFTALTGGDLPPDVDVAAALPPKIYQAHRGTPVIDGEIDEIWETAEIVSTDIQVMSIPGAVAQVRALWDEQRLYFLAEVTDPLLNSAGGQRHEHDSFEVFLDQNNAKTATFESDDFQFRVNYRNMQSFSSGARSAMMENAAVITDTGYRIELAITLSAVTGARGRQVGIDFQVNDADDSGTRVAISKWNDPTNESWRNTSGWGILEMVD